jgi:hypothetical protein
MSEPAAGLWDERAAHFDDWGVPLRPPADAIALYAGFVRRRFSGRAEPLPALLLGITPELALARWPVPLRLTAVDQSEPMVRRVWPGDQPGERRAIVGDWMRYRPDDPPALVMTDGAAVFFSRPESLFERAAAFLGPDGVFLIRAFCAPPQRASLDTVLAAARAGEIETFHGFKWRVAMALQDGPRAGVAQHRIWETITRAGIDFASLPQPGFSASACSTLRFYRDQAATLHFPTAAGYAAALRTAFAEVEWARSAHADGERYVVFCASTPLHTTR